MTLNIDDIKKKITDSDITAEAKDTLSKKLASLGETLLQYSKDISADGKTKDVVKDVAEDVAEDVADEAKTIVKEHKTACGCAEQAKSCVRKNPLTSAGIALGAAALLLVALKRK